MLLALVLGDMAESAMRQSLLMSQGSLWIFVQPPIALPLVIAAALIVCWPLLGPTIRRLRATRVPAKT
jgi:putative tricarboxylic transport membrane protein